MGSSGIFPLVSRVTDVIMQFKEQNIPEKTKNREVKFFGQGELLFNEDLKFGCKGEVLFDKKVPEGKKWNVIVNIAIVESDYTEEIPEVIELDF